MCVCEHKRGGCVCVCMLESDVIQGQSAFKIFMFVSVYMCVSEVDIFRTFFVKTGCMYLYVCVRVCVYMS